MIGSFETMRYYVSVNSVFLTSSVTHNSIQFKNQIKNRISFTSYQGNSKLKLHNMGQEAGNGGTQWTFTSVPIMEVIEDTAPVTPKIVQFTTLNSLMINIAT